LARGGFNPNLISTDFGHASASFLGSEHSISKRAGITIDYTTVAADSNGNRYLMAGTAMGKITASEKYGPYCDTNGDGREDGQGLLEHDVEVRTGDGLGSLMLHGAAIEARCVGVDAAFKVDCPLIIFY